MSKIVMDWKQKFMNAGCPNCGATRGGPRGLHHHSLSVWCLRCGFGRDWVDLEAGYRK